MGPADSSQPDPGMLELFQAEMDTHIPVLNEGLLALERGEVVAPQIEGMMRAAHSIKGAARIVGIPAAVQVAHVLEDCFTAAKECRITIRSQSADVLLKGVDALQRLCNPAESAAVSSQALDVLIAAIASVRDGKLTTVTQGNATQTDAAHASTAQAISPGDTRVTSAPTGFPADLVAARVERDEPSVTLPAHFDQASLAAVRRELLDTLALRPASIQMDFSQSTQMPALGLALFASFAAEVLAAKPVPVIVCKQASASVVSVFRAAGLGKVFGME